MSAHIALPALNAGDLRPGTVLPGVLTGILRDSLGFKGIVVTDALNMAGVANAYGAGAAVRAFLAGADLLLQPADPKAAIDAMAAAVERGEISTQSGWTARCSSSWRRRSPSGFSGGGRCRSTASPISSAPPSSQAGRGPMAERSIVMVKDVGGTVHGLKSARPPLSLVTYGEEDNRTVGLALAGGAPLGGLLGQSLPALARERSGELRLRGLGPGARVAWRSSRPPTVPLRARHDRASGAADHLDFARWAATGPTILISLGNPYLISSLPEVGSYLIGWRANSVTEQAVARALAGKAAITGRLPIAIPPEYPRGWGVVRRAS